MSTSIAVPQTNAGGFSFSQPEAQKRPRLFLTGKITAISDPKTTQNGDGNYESCSLTFEGTNGSRKIFPNLLFRAEQFSRGFDVKSYIDYKSYPYLQAVPEGKKLTLGEAFTTVYRNNIYPKVECPTGGKNAGKRRATSVPTLMALCGGTLDGIDGFTRLVGQANDTIQDRAKGDFGVCELTPDEIINLLRKYREGGIGDTELCLLAKQSTDMQGDLTDRYELAQWIGPYNSDNDAYMVQRAERTAEEDVSKRVQLGYEV